MNAPAYNWMPSVATRCRSICLPAAIWARVLLMVSSGSTPASAMNSISASGNFAMKLAFILSSLVKRAGRVWITSSGGDLAPVSVVQQNC